MSNKKQVEYSKKYNKKKNKFYVYVYLDPRKKSNYKYGEFEFDFEPFYVGKGSGFRDKCHLNEYNLNFISSYKNNKIKKILSENLSPIIIRVKKNLLENDAFNLEVELIRLIGRNDLGLGPLTNLTNGGDGISGYKFSDDFLDTKKVKVKQFSLNGEFIKEWESIDLVKKEFGYGSITDVCRLKRFSLNNFIWRYSDDIENISNLQDFISKYHERTYNIRSINGKTNNKKIIEYDINKKTTKEWHSLSEANKFYGVSTSAISQSIIKNSVCLNKFWFYLENYDEKLLNILLDKYNLKVKLTTENKKNLIDTTYKASKGKKVIQSKNGIIINTWNSITIFINI